MRRIMCCKTSKNYVIDTQGSLYTEREMQMAGNVPRVERERERERCRLVDLGSGALESAYI